MASLAFADIPLSLYVHFPWCVRKCPYCDFNSHALRDNLPEDRYLEALTADLDEELAACEGRPLASVFFGGGTPSLVSPGIIAAVIDRIAVKATLAEDVEITLEANPGASDRARFTGYRAAGVNRLSIGVQSFSDRLLKSIGRIHDARGARAAVEAARSAGFDNLNIDIMFGLPGQRRDEAAADIDTAIALLPEHISYYQLTLEPNTLFFEKPPELPHEDETFAMQEYALSRLRDNGWFRYEVSAFARLGRESVHNRNYWEFGDYLGAGAGAHGKTTASTGVTRYTKPRHPRDYMATVEHFRRSQKNVGGEDLLFEFMLGALRLRDGVPLAMFEQRTGISGDVLERRLMPMIDRRLVRWADGRVRTTERGFLYLDDILETLLPPAAGK